MGLCPFHSEKTPSFTVSPTKQFYHCFGCGAHGNAIGFLMAYAGMGYVDAIKDLASAVGMQVPELQPRTPEEAARKERETDLYAVMEKAMEFYRAELKKSPRAIEYLKGRGLTGEIAARFRIGYAPDGWQGLKAVFAKYDDKSLVECGLVIEDDEGKRYDRFRDRVMFPILNARGAVIGFGGRVLGEGEPKYLNSPETPLFEKGREVYGLVQARDAIRAAGRVLVVEGYMDVVALAQFDVGYAVATLGTATTPVHVTKLLQLADELVFSFDGDAAGPQGGVARARGEPAARAGPQADPLPVPARRRRSGHLRPQARQGRVREAGAAKRRRFRSSCSPSCAPVRISTTAGGPRRVPARSRSRTCRRSTAPALRAPAHQRGGRARRASPRTRSERLLELPQAPRVSPPGAGQGRASRATDSPEWSLLYSLLAGPVAMIVHIEPALLDERSAGEPGACWRSSRRVRRTRSSSIGRCSWIDFEGIPCLEMRSATPTGTARSWDSTAEEARQRVPARRWASWTCSPEGRKLERLLGEDCGRKDELATYNDKLKVYNRSEARCRRKAGHA